MVYTDFNRPSANMLLPVTQINEMLRIQKEEAAKSEDDAIRREQADYDRKCEERASYVNEYFNSQINSVNNRAAFLENVKTGFLSAAMLKLFKECVGYTNQRDEIVMKNLVTSFINEQGVGELLNRFKYKNVLTAEMGRVVREAYGRVLESITKTNEDESTIPGKCKDLKLDQTIVDDFYKDLTEVDTVEASKLIKDKVADAMSEFVDQNMQNRVDYKEVIDTAKEKMDTVQDESVIEQIRNNAERRIHEMKLTRPKNVFHYMVEAISKETFKDPSLKTRYVHESSVDMDSIVRSAELIYTMLEMANTTEMVDESYIQNYIISLTNM